MPTNGKLACCAIMAIMVFSSIMVFNQAAATNVASLIATDTTWTLAGSPYTLTGPTAVNKGITLTIEPGVKVYLNDYYIQVNGTLIAVGSDSRHITFDGGSIYFTVASNGWDRQKGIGNRIEFSEIKNTNLGSDNAIKLANNVITGDLILGDNSILSNNEIKASRTITVGDSAEITGNTVKGIFETGDRVVISNNSMDSGGQAGDYELTTGTTCTISGNTITGPAAIPSRPGSIREYNGTIHTGAQSVIANNNIYGTIAGSPSEIRGNTIIGGGLLGDDPAPIYTVWIESNYCQIMSNLIRSTTGKAIQARSASLKDNYILGEVFISSDSKSAFIEYNTITGDISGGNSYKNNRILGSIQAFGSMCTIISNLVEGNIYGATEGQELIKDNKVIGGQIAGAGTIQNNIITGGSGNGITVGTAPTIVELNTISQKSKAILVYGGSQVIIRNNNFEECSVNIWLLGSGDLDASNNWWGTTDEQAINDSIHDFKNDFNLGKVTYKPFLSSPNQQAGSAQNINLPDLTPIPITPSAAANTSNAKPFYINLLLLLFIFGILVASGVIAVVLVLWLEKMPNKSE